MTRALAPLCMWCKRYHRDRDDEGYHCDAFPEGIPEEIIDNRADHRQVFPGDRGLRFEEAKQPPALLLKALDAGTAAEPISDSGPRKERPQ